MRKVQRWEKSSFFFCLRNTLPFPTSMSGTPVPLRNGKKSGNGCFYKRKFIKRKKTIGNLFRKEGKEGGGSVPYDALYEVTMELQCLTDKERLVSELTRSYSWGLDTSWNSLCVYNVGRKARSSDCIGTVLSVFKSVVYK